MWINNSEKRLRKRGKNDEKLKFKIGVDLYIFKVAESLLGVLQATFWDAIEGGRERGVKY